MYKENNLLKISTGKSVSVNFGFITKADEGNYICKVFWISKQGIRIKSKSIKILVNRQYETSINTGSSVSFNCDIPRSNWLRVGHVLLHLLGYSLKKQIFYLNFILPRLVWVKTV